MSSYVQTTRVTQVVRHLPAPLVKLLDAWSHRLAQRRAAQRRQKWLQRQAAPTATLDFHVKALGD
jgi:hypothetical protein